MKDTKTQEQELIGPQKALQRYLDDLLQDATEFTEPDVGSEIVDASAEDTEQDSSVLESSVPESSILDESAQETAGQESGTEQGKGSISEVSEIEAESEIEDALDLSFADFEAAIQPLQQEFESSGKQETTVSTIENEDVAGLGLTIGTPDLTYVETSVEDNEESLNSEFESEVESEFEGSLASAEVVPEASIDEVSPTEVVEALEAEPTNDEVAVEVASSALLQDSEQRDSVESAVDSEQTIDTVEELEPKKQILPTDPLPWAQSRFECLLFYVGKLKLAVPLVELGGIHQGNDEKLTAIFGQPKWFLGMSNVGDFNLRTVDTAKWVMPDHYEGELKEHFKFVIQLDRSDWGLACESVAEAITLEPSEVKWRSDRSRRPWLAGTVIDHMCAILDVQGFITLLEDPENGFRKHLKHVD